MNKVKTSTRIVKALSMRAMIPADLSAITGIPKSAISSYLKDRYEPKQKAICLMAEALGVNEAWLMGLDVPWDRDFTIAPTEDEKKLLIAYRQANDSPKAAVMALAKAIEEVLELDE